MKKIAALILCTLLLVGLCLALTACGECKHNYGEPTVTEPTCTEDGKYTYTCTKCGESMDLAPEADEVEMLKKGHTEDPDGVVTAAASCTTDGQRTYSCTVCEAELRTETIAAAGHAPDLGTVTTPPTCTEAGVKTIKCANYGCGETLGTEPIAALGHDVDADAFETDGTNHYNVCERTDCGAKLNTAACSFTIDAVDAEKHANICSVCAGQKGEAEAHTFGAEQTIAASTDTCASGKTYKVCTACTYENVIATFPGALAHTYAFDAEATTMDEVEHADSTHGYVGGTLVYTCVGCDGSYVIAAEQATCFDGDCPCGFTLDYFGTIKDPDEVMMKIENGEISIVGQIAMVDGDGDGIKAMINNLDVRMFGAGTPMASHDPSKPSYISFDIRAVAGGFPEWGVQPIYKCNGAWVNPTLVMKDNKFTFNGAELALDTTKNHNVVISIFVTPGVGVTYNVWVDGVQLGTAETKADARCNTNFNDGSTNYGGLKVDAAGGTNVDTTRGFVMDNVAWTQTAPTFVP